MPLSNFKIEILQTLADCYIETKQINEAIKTLRAALQLNPKATTPRLKLGLAFYNSHMVAEAVQQWENVLQIEPKNDEALRYIKMAQTTGMTSLSF
jgi:tetratricopeptide (TPR) repeat protein